MKMTLADNIIIKAVQTAMKKEVGHGADLFFRNVEKVQNDCHAIRYTFTVDTYIENTGNGIDYYKLYIDAHCLDNVACIYMDGYERDYGDMLPTNDLLDDVCCRILLIVW